MPANLNAIVLSVSKPPKIRKSLRVQLELAIAEIVNKKSTTEIRLFKIANAYAYFIRALQLEETVVLEGIPKEKAEEIVKIVIDHEVQSPQISSIIIIDLISKLPQRDSSGHILKLLSKTRRSIINRFTLYTNLYNLENRQGRDRLFNYCAILQIIWSSHRQYRHTLWLLINTDSQIEKYINSSPTEYSSAQNVKIQGKAIFPSTVDLRQEIERITSKVLQRIKANEEIDRIDMQRVKYYRIYFSTLSYHAYCIHICNSHDILLLFYELFDEKGVVASYSVLNKISSAIHLHISGFKQKIERLEKIKPTLPYLEVRIKEFRETINAFYNPNYSTLIYTVVPLVHRVASCVLFCNIGVYLMILLYNNTTDTKVSNSSLFRRTVYLLCIYSTALCAFVFIGVFLRAVFQKNRPVYYSQKLHKRISVQGFVRALCISILLIQGALWCVFGVNTFTSVLYVAISYILGSAAIVLAVCDSSIRTHFVFSCQAGRRSFTLFYIFTILMFFCLYVSVLTRN